MPLRPLDFSIPGSSISPGASLPALPTLSLQSINEASGLHFNFTPPTLAAPVGDISRTPLGDDFSGSGFTGTFPPATGGPSSLSVDPFTQTPEGSGFLSGLTTPSGTFGLPTPENFSNFQLPDFTPSSGDLTSGINVPSGADSSTSLNVSPDIAALPGSADNMSLGNVYGQTITGQDLFPGQSGSISTPFTSNTAQTSFYNWLVNVSTDFFLRAAVFIVGAVMLAVAAYAFAREGKLG